MPQMDGYQTIGVIREIRRSAGFPSLLSPRKQMKGDREKCLEAGAPTIWPAGEHRAIAPRHTHVATSLIGAHDDGP